MKILITALALTAILATSAFAKTPRPKEVRVQPNSSLSHSAVTRSSTQIKSQTAASTAGRPILIPESVSSLCATVGIGNTKSDTGLCNIGLITAKQEHTRRGL